LRDPVVLLTAVSLSSGRLGSRDGYRGCAFFSSV
jgi:hypothetical protein